MLEFLLVVHQSRVWIDGEHIRILLRIIGALQGELYFSIQSTIFIGSIDLQNSCVHRGIFPNRCRDDALLTLFNTRLMEGDEQRFGFLCCERKREQIAYRVIIDIVDGDDQLSL